MPATPDRPAGVLTPRQWIPFAGFFGVAIAVLAVMLVMKDGGGDVVVNECTPGEPGCELRQPVHWHADFAVYLRGEQVDFSDPSYLSTLEGQELSENVHIHEPRYTVVHVHREQSTWDEFLTSLGWTLTDTCITPRDGEQLCTNEAETLRFYVNGVRIDSLRFQNISDLDRVLITYGDESDAEIAEQIATITDEACIVSELCLDRIPPEGLEEEPCTGRGSCTG